MAGFRIDDAKQMDENFCVRTLGFRTTHALAGKSARRIGGALHDSGRVLFNLFARAHF